MTYQNWIHKHCVNSGKTRKSVKRHKGHREYYIPHHTRKWWDAWYKTWEHDFEKEFGE